MKIILPLLPDPTDLLVQWGADIEVWMTKNDLFMDLPVIPATNALENPYLQGWLPTQAIPELPASRPMLNAWPNVSAMFDKVGPKVFSDGELKMLPIKPGPVPVLVDPTQAWQFSTINLDSTGALGDMGNAMINDYRLEALPIRRGFADIVNPLAPILVQRTEVLNSGLSKLCNVAGITPLGMNLMESFPEDTGRWLLSGVTKDSTGAALGNCRVVVLETARIGVQQNPVVGEMISDGSGNFSFTVPRNTGYQVVAYLPGSPDVAGVTRNDLAPVANG